jgi:hypothetical protein
MDQQIDITADRKRFHRPIAGIDDDVEVCNFCSKPLSKVMDEINGIELVCENRSCPGR